MDGIIYLLNQSGMALAQATAQIQKLTEEIEALKTALANQTPSENKDR